MNRRIINLSLSFLRIRFLQAGRFLKELGIIRTFILLIFCIHIIFLASRIYFSDTIIAGTAAVLTLFSIHVARKDRKFLAFTFGREGHVVMALEYAVLSLPCSIYYIYSGNLWSLLILLAALISIPFVNLKINRINSSPSLSKLFPARAFELRSCFRENKFMLLPAVILGVVFAKHLAVPVCSMVAVTLILAFSTTYNEPLIMLETFKSPGKLLGYKVLTYLVVLMSLLTPLILSFLLLHGKYWYILGCLMAACCIILILSILLKYAFYTPNEEVLVNKILIGVSIVCFIIVYLAPLPLIMLGIYYFKARYNLKRYFYAAR